MSKAHSSPEVRVSHRNARLTVHGRLVIVQRRRDGWKQAHSASARRFAEADLSSILDHHAHAPKAGEHRASEDSSLTQGTSAWARLGQHDAGGVTR